MSKEFWAHSGADAPHLLEANLVAVGERAALNAKRFGPAWAYMAGLWHDLGKYRPGFQTYIRQTADAHIKGKPTSRSDKSYSAAGALHALETLRRHFGANGERVARLLAYVYVIAGHHAGLAARGQMATHGLYVFEHAGELGNALSHVLFDRLAVNLQGDADAPACDFGAYSVSFDGKALAVGDSAAAAPGFTLTRRC